MHRHLWPLLFFAVVVSGVFVFGWILVREISSHSPYDEAQAAELITIGIFCILVALAGSVGLRVVLVPFVSEINRTGIQLVWFWMGLIVCIVGGLFETYTRDLGVVAMSFLMVIAGLIMVYDSFYTSLTFHNGNNDN